MLNTASYLSEVIVHIENTIKSTQYQCSKKTYRGISWGYYHGEKDLIVEWIKQQIYKFERQEQSGEFYQQYKDLYKINCTTAEAVLRSTSLFFQPVFKANFTDNFVAQLAAIKLDKQKKLLAWMNYIVMGHLKTIPNFYQVQVCKHKGQLYERLFVVQVESKSLVFMLTVQQLPTHKEEKNLEKTLMKFDYQQVIVFLSIITPLQTTQLVNGKHAKLYSTVMKEYLSESGYGFDHKMLVPAKMDPNNYFICDNGRITLNEEPESGEDIHLKDNPLFNDIKTLVPNKFLEARIQSADREMYYWNKQTSRWTSRDKEYLSELSSMKMYQEEVSNYVISQCLNFGSAEKLVKVLQKIPNFKVKLSDEQSHIIGSSGNVVCIGRSGTGKTTSAVLRMFSLEMLFKYRLAVYNQKHQASLKNTRFNPRDIDKNVGIRCIFVTASPVLTNEIKRYYDRLTKQLKEELIKRDERKYAEELEEQIVLKKQREEKFRKDHPLEAAQLDVEAANKASISETDNHDEIQLKIESNLNEETDQVEKLMEDQFNNLTLKKEVSQEKVTKEEEQEQLKMEDEEEDDLQRDMDRFENLGSMSPSDFPAFMTIRNLIMLTDASLKYPFFKRNKDGRIKGQTVQNTWHNEQKGTLYINSHYKNLNINAGAVNGQDFSGIDNAVEVDSDDSEEEDQNAKKDQDIAQNEFILGKQYTDTIKAQEKKLKSITASRVKQVANQKKMAYEIDFDYFKRFFWKRIQNRTVGYKQLDAHLVWTEIYSNIKGSGQSCYYWSGCSYGISKVIYKREQSRLTDAEVDKLYEIYHEYEAWKQKEGCYDFMDVVNYIIRSYSYSFNKDLVPLHYMMVDEVQDLPMNVLYLLKKLVTHGVFYSGDTAQTIAQGVGFRYGNLKTLFESDGQTFSGESGLISKNVTIQQLTINFRSHNKILYMANSVIDLLEQFFPDTIDRLKKERSQIDGPKPIIISDGDPEMLFCLLSGNSNFVSKRHSSNEGAMGRNPLEFGCSQVVLVRNQESKKKLPGMLQHALCLTIYEAKGLEFDDVVLYNFFEDSQMDPQKWNLLRYMQYETQFMTLSAYNLMLQDQENERNRLLTQIHDLRQVLIQEEWQEKIQRQSLQYVQDDVKREDIAFQLNQKVQRRTEKMEELSKLEAVISSDAVYGIPISDTTDEGEGMMKVVKLKVNSKSMQDYNVQGKDFSQLCLELKQLYVSITRPKNRLIIFDSDASSRKHLQEYWETLGCVELITAEVLSGKIEQKNSENSGVDVSAALSRKSNKTEWMNQGLRMMKLKYYQQAMLCFNRAENAELERTARVFNLAEQAKDKLEEAQREQIFLDQGIVEYASLSKPEKVQVQKVISANIREARKMFREVGDNFAEQGKFKQAAKCYFSALSYDKAASMYLNIGNKKSAAECYYILKEYNKAADLFVEIGEFTRSIECLDLLEDWPRVLEVINILKPKMTFKQREMYIKRYAPLALEELVANVGLSGIQIQQKTVEKRQKVIDFIHKEQIAEEDEDEEEKEGMEEQVKKESQNEITDDKSQEQEPNEQNESSNKEEAAEVKNKDNNEDNDSDSLGEIDFGENSVVIVEQDKPKPKVETQSQNDSVSIMEMDFSHSQASHQLQHLTDHSIISHHTQGNNNAHDHHDNTSFIEGMSLDEGGVDLSNMSFELYKSKNQLSDFEHLSNFDPEDEWLKLENGSIADVINKSRQSGVFSCSDYSAVNLNDCMSTKAQMIKTSADIFIQDEIMQQVIHYMSMFSDNFKAEIIKIKSADVLLSSRIEKNDESLNESAAHDFLIDLDNIDMKFLYLILDTLEHYNIFRLAIFVCNRYKLSKKAGRYMVSLAHRFSPCPTSNNIFDIKMLNNTPEKQRRVEQSMIANIAVHNLFEVINPEFLRLKRPDESVGDHNSLGVEVFRSLLLLGYWKKILFIMDYNRSLQLASYFSDFQSYKTIFLSYNSQYKNKASCIDSLKSQTPDFHCLPFDLPRNSSEIEFAIIALEHVIFYNNSKQRLSKPSTHNLSYNQFKQNDPDSLYEDSITFPDYFPYNSTLWNYLNHKVLSKFSKNPAEDITFAKSLGQSLSEALEILQSKKYENFPSEIISLKIFDIFSFYGNVLLHLQTQDKLSQIILTHLDLPGFLAFAQVGVRILELFSTFTRLSDFDYLILRGLLSPLKIRLNQNSSDLLEVVGQLRVCVLKTSKIVEQFAIYSKPDYSFINLNDFDLQPLSYEDFCYMKFGKINKHKYRSPYYTYYAEKKAAYNNIQNLLKQSSPNLINELEVIVQTKEDKAKVKEIKKQLEFQNKKNLGKFFFLDMDCDFISGPLEEVIQYFKESTYKLILTMIQRRIGSQLKSASLKSYSLEKLFLLSAYNLGYAELLKEADHAMQRKEGETHLNLHKDKLGVPEYKKFKKSNPMYKFYKLEYLKKIDDRADEEDDEDIKRYMEFEGLIKKKKKVSHLSLKQKIQRQLTKSLRGTYQGVWSSANLHPYVKQVLLNNVLESISQRKIELCQDLQRINKYALILNILDQPSYLLEVQSLPEMRKYTKMSVDSIFMMRKGELKQAINTTLDVCDKFFDDLETEDKLNRLEYCLIWSMIGFKASQGDRFVIHLCQSFMKQLPPLTFAEFTTDLQDENQMNVPSSFTATISITPIDSCDLITDILSYIRDIMKKQTSLMADPKKVLMRLLSLVFIVLYNLKDSITESLATEALDFFDFIDADITLVKLIESMDFWEDIIQSRNAQDLKEIIPALISYRMFAFDDNISSADVIQEIVIDNLRDKAAIAALNEQSLSNKDLNLAARDIAKKREAARIIKEKIGYEGREITKKLQRAKSNIQALLFTARLSDKKKYPVEDCLQVSIHNHSVFQFFPVCDSYVNDLLCAITVNSVTDPLDFHYLMMQLGQVETKYVEFMELLASIFSKTEQKIIDPTINPVIEKSLDSKFNATVMKCQQDIAQKSKDLVKWAGLQQEKGEETDINVIFLQNKISIAIKWAKTGQYADAKKLVQTIDTDLKLREANSLKLNLSKEAATKLGNKLSKNNPDRKNNKK